MPFETNPLPGIPYETYQAARKVFNNQHVHIKIGDHLKDILDQTDLSAFASAAASKGDTVFRLALATAFQYAEQLSDLAASESTLRRMDWKYALYLPINYPGITALALCEFRKNIFASPKGMEEFSRLLNRLSDYGLFDRRPVSSLESSRVLFEVCDTTRLAKLKQAMQNALSTLVAVAPDWLREHALPHWYDRYKTRKSQTDRLPELLSKAEEANRLGSDIHWLLNALEEHGSQEVIRQPEIRILAQLWGEQFVESEGGVSWRQPGCAGCSCNLLGGMDL